jgi:DNA-binding YbaB/EbfC family protein
MNFGKMTKMMKDLQKMQTKLQAELDTLEEEASAGGGVVTARMNGKKELLSIKLAPEAITDDDPEMMEDLIVAAVNEVGRKVDAKIQEMTQGMAGGLGLPGMG